MACSGEPTTSGGSTGDQTSSSSSGGGTGACPADTVCLDVKVLQGSPSKARVAIVWFQLDDDGPDPDFLMGYDAPFDPVVERIEIPIASIALPNAENLLCPRACDDESMCPCTGDPQLGIGLVFVVPDANGDGKLDATELEPQSGLLGIGNLAFGYSAQAVSPLPTPYDTIFPEGVDAGVRPYHLMKDSQMVFDRMHKSKDGDVFDLNICGDNADPACMLPFPNLT